MRLTGEQVEKVEHETCLLGPFQRNLLISCMVHLALTGIARAKLRRATWKAGNRFCRESQYATSMGSSSIQQSEDFKQWKATITMVSATPTNSPDDI